jgi:hypothetical protein
VSSPDRAATVVLLEGRSDVAAVRAVAATLGLSGADARLVDMGGVTNVRRHVAAARRESLRVVGMCDAGEADVVARALGVGPGELADHGFTVCRADLEEELIRAAGPDRVLALLDRLGLSYRFAVLQRQPAWRGRPVEEQLHRFAGVASGRKALLAGALAADLAADEVPPPLRQLVTGLTVGVTAGQPRSVGGGL